MNPRWLSIVFAVGLTIISGVGDAQGFLHASKIWQDQQVNWGELGRSALGYAFGIAVYWFSIRFFNDLGITSPEIQTIGWFVVTITGVALFSGEFLKWNLMDQILGFVAIIAVGLLMVRRGG